VAVSKQGKETPIQGFQQLALAPVTLAALERARYSTPTPVQAGVIPRALAGDDVLGQARTGTGKTASFVIPILESLDKIRSPHPLALILVPTRELAVQVHDEFNKLAYGRRAHAVAIYGGKPIRQQMERLQRGPQVVVGTPGRVLDHMSRRTIRLDALKWVVLDEADRMLDIGFRPDIERILRHCPKERQTLLLSATLPPPVLRLAQRYMHNPVQLDFSTGDLSVETIEQFYFTVDQRKKFDLLQRLLRRENATQAIIFCRTKRGTDRVYDRLHKRLAGVGCMHGDMAQAARDRVMAKFREGQIRYLVATDVVGRGIDVTRISHIINYDIPQFSDDYVHRVGRTGRMGREGVAYTFVTPEEGNELTRIEIRINRLLQRDALDGIELQGEPEPHRNEKDNEPGRALQAQDKPKPPPPLYGRGGRPRKKYRKAL
jgi:ATP-dependent RNA helicase DeaD